MTRNAMVTAFITLNSGGWRKGWHRKSSHASPSARRFTTADKGFADQHPFMDLSWTCQIILDAQGTYRHPAPAIRETSHSDLLTPVFLPPPPPVSEPRRPPRALFGLVFVSTNPNERQVLAILCPDELLDLLVGRVNPRVVG